MWIFGSVVETSTDVCSSLVSSKRDLPGLTNFIISTHSAVGRFCVKSKACI
jgi:hypothetical protein